MSKSGVDTPLTLRAVSKAYGERTVLDRVSLTIDQGETVAVTGPSGSGKSTILNLAGLLDSPDTGTVSLFGDPAPRPRSSQATRLLRYRLGYLFQNFALVEAETVQANLEVALAYARDRRDHATRISRVLTRVGLAGFEERKVYSLSGGEQQRVALARLWLKPCGLVLADEPTGSLDDDNRDGIVSLLQEMNEDGRTILMATHDPVVASVCTRTIDVLSLNPAEHSPADAASEANADR